MVDLPVDAKVAIFRSTATARLVDTSLPSLAPLDVAITAFEAEKPSLLVSAQSALQLLSSNLLVAGASRALANQSAKM